VRALVLSVSPVCHEYQGRMLASYLPVVIFLHNQYIRQARRERATGQVIF
jgi:hypothetical protein